MTLDVLHFKCGPGVGFCSIRFLEGRRVLFRQQLPLNRVEATRR